MIDTAQTYEEIYRAGEEEVCDLRIDGVQEGICQKPVKACSLHKVPVSLLICQQ